MRQDWKPKSGVFISFPGNCREALTFYQRCFGGTLYLQNTNEIIYGRTAAPLVCGSLISDTVVIYGSDLLHDDGRKIGNYISVFLLCNGLEDRKLVLSRLMNGTDDALRDRTDVTDALVEVTDPFDVRWILGVPASKKFP